MVFFGFFFFFFFALLLCLMHRSDRAIGIDINLKEILFIVITQIRIRINTIRSTSTEITHVSKQLKRVSLVRNRILHRGKRSQHDLLD